MSTAFLRLLTDEQLHALHDAALSILERTGMQVDHATALDILASNGAGVDRSTNRVRFPRSLVEAKLALLPRSFTYHGRSPEFDTVLSVEGPIAARVAGGATGYVDLDTGQHRRARIEDWAEFACLVDAMPSVCSVATLHCGDVPAETADIHSLNVLLRGQRKCVVHNAFTLENMRYLIELMLAVAGSREQLERRPPVHHMLSPISPLHMQEDDTSQLLLACEYGIPTDIPIMSLVGATAPITLAGTLAQTLAEFLGVMTIAQSARPGHSMPFFMDPVAVDMHTGNARVGAPETGLLAAAIQQIGTELYGLPAEGLGFSSDGFDRAQGMSQRSRNSALAVMAGAKLVIGAGVVEGLMAVDPVQLVIDDQIMATLRRLARGITVSEDTLAVDAIDRVGPRGQYLDDDHTIDHLRDGELVDPGMFVSGGREAWEARGGASLEEQARNLARSTLASHAVPALPDDVLRELDRIVAAADGDLAAVGV